MRAVSNTNTGRMPPPPPPPPRDGVEARRASSTERHRAGLSCSRRSEVRNQCTVSRRHPSSVPSFAAEEPPVIAFGAEEEEEEEEDDDDERPDAADGEVGGKDAETADRVDRETKVGGRREAAERVRYAE